jgi:N-acetylneuraminic acid mutarotase
MWVIAGHVVGSPCDCFVSGSTNGATWGFGAEAPFAGREEASSVVYNNAMWVTAGWNLTNSQDINDTWYTTDGSNWTRANTFPPALPARAGHTSVVFDNMMFVIAGTGNSEYANASLNDIWYSVDGNNWTEATAAAAFSPRYCHSSVVFNNQMWVIAGMNSSGNFLNDVWSGQ